jgi:hypothetical protein
MVQVPNHKKREILIKMRQLELPGVMIFSIGTGQGKIIRLTYDLNR